LGAIYEVGAMLALDDSLEGIDVTDLDVYVGVSSGGFVAAALANGVSPAQLYRLFIEDGVDATMKPQIFLRPALREYARRAASLPAILAHATREYLGDPLHHSLMESYAVVTHAIPTGVFDNDAIDRYLTSLFSAPGRTNDFRELSRKLYLVATNLDTGASVTFGGRGYDDVPISRAIEASAALPGLFPPVLIKGEHYVDGALNKTLHASVALEQGVDLLLCVNPLVPFDASRARSGNSRLTVEKLNEGGLPVVLSQTFRAIIHSRMHVGMERYMRQYPHADIVLFEPDREDAELFFANVFSYKQRKHLCASAFRKIRQRLRSCAAELTPQLGRHGISLRHDRLQDFHRNVTHAVSDPRPLRSRPGSTDVRQTTRDLNHTLDQLERWLRHAH
jgi:predicted acylesterase/phospholipase RssA